jgi:transcriptional regulator with XRE-family HTH domain
MERNFRKLLRDELDYHGLTVKELAAKSSIALGAINSYLGKQASMPPADVAVKLAAALGVTVEYLINGQDKSREPPVTFFFQVPKSALCFVFLMN